MITCSTCCIGDRSEAGPGAQPHRPIPPGAALRSRLRHFVTVGREMPSSSANLRVRQCPRRGQHDPGAQGDRLGGLPARGPGLQDRAFFVGQDDLNSSRRSMTRSLP